MTTNQIFNRHYCLCLNHKQAIEHAILEVENIIQVLWHLHSEIAEPAYREYNAILNELKEMR